MVNPTSQQTAPRFRYPENVGQAPVDKWILFEAKEGRHVIRRKVDENAAVDKTIASAALYLPDGAMKSQIESLWDQTATGPFMGAIMEILGRTGENMLNTTFTSSQARAAAAPEMLKKMIGNLKDHVDDKGGIVNAASTAILDALATAGQAGAASILQGLPDAVAATTGHRVNPKTDLLYTHTQYRVHDMEFMLIPRNEFEAKQINNIIKFFQFYMLPSFGNGTADGTAGQLGASSFLIGFPYEFKVTMFTGGNDDKKQLNVNRIGRSVLKTCAIDHAAAGKTSFIKNGTDYYPVATKLTLHFEEVQILGRDSEEINRAGTVNLEDPRNDERNT